MGWGGDGRRGYREESPGGGMGMVSVSGAIPTNPHISPFARAPLVLVYRKCLASTREEQ